ncbi:MULTISPECIES: PH domain-containing protein [Micrococcaceae]|uniref:PH domain-containing protein n=1 Tax=unclassified Kocuria TaxID=2649579 RepID=UPI001010AA38|nr:MULTISPECIES: PH domain-containing protein [unclassified Kocuria]
MKDSQIPATKDWERVHPLSPLARFWFAILIFLFAIGRHFIEDAFEGQTDVQKVRHGFGEFFASLSLIAWLGLIFAIVLVLGGMFWSWWFTRYLVTEDSVRMRQGYFFRKEKQARLDRVQSIEIFQPFFARLVGMAELRFDVADSGDSALHLQYLRKTEAEELRARLLGRKQTILAKESGTGDSAVRPALSRSESPWSQDLPVEGQSGDPATTAEPSVGGTGAYLLGPGTSPTGPRVDTESPIASVGVGRAVLATLLGSTGIWFVIVLLASLSFAIFLPEVGGFIFIPAALSLVSGVWSSVNTSANFRVARTQDGLKVRYGLTSTRTQTLPLGKIQAVGIEQPVLWRIPGWFRVRINTAGLGSSSSEGEHRVLLPVGAGQDLMNLLPHIVATTEAGIDGHQLRAALEGSGPGYGFVVAPRRSRWLDPFSYRRNGYSNTADLLLLRGGWLKRRLSVVPHERTQSASITNGPLLRLLGLADVRLDSVGGSVRTTVAHLAVDDARRMIRDQANRAAFARRLTSGRIPRGAGTYSTIKDEAHYD